MKLDFLREYEFFAGVPDSQLKALCGWLMNTYGTDANHHVIAANEGNAVAMAAGYHLSTGRIPVVYLQNSGIGNIINPVASLLNDKVYGIPCVFIVGWRGEPGIHDEPQHIFQGEVTLKLLEDMDIKTFVISKDTTDEELASQTDKFRPLLAAGKSVAYVIRKGALEYDGKVTYKNENIMVREEVVRRIAKAAVDDIIVSTTGKTSRELFEIREANGESHSHDFLTVGSMGHSSSIALAIAINRPERRVWCIDGDGAALMHMGAMALIGANQPKNMVHIVINNAAHESVGGMPTVANKTDLVKIAEGCGYPCRMSVRNYDALDEALKQASESDKLTFIEVKAAIGARENLARPTTTARENKENFMKYLAG